MSLCNCILDEYSLTCRDNIGGIQKVYIGCYDSDYEFITSGTYSEITGVTYSNNVTFYLMEQEIETGSFIQDGQFSTENGTSFYEQTLEITLHKMDAVLRNRIAALGQGAWRVIILDQRGTYWLMGFQNPVRVSAANPQLGKLYGDLNGAIITFIGKEPVPAYVIDPALIPSIIP